MVSPAAIFASIVVSLACAVIVCPPSYDKGPTPTG